MVLPKELLGNVDIFLDDEEDRQLLERAAQGLPGISGRLAEPELKIELVLFLRMCYKNKSQHKSATYFRTITHVKALATRHKQLDAASVVAELASLITPPANAAQTGGGVGASRGRPGTTVVAASSSSGSWSLPSRQAMAFGLGRLRASVLLCAEIGDVILACSRALSVLLSQAYFMPFATMATGTLARMYVLYCTQGHALAEAYNLVAAAAHLFPASLATDGAEAAVGWDASVRRATAELPGTLTWSVSVGKPPSVAEDGKLQLWPNQSAVLLPEVPPTAPRTLEGAVAAEARQMAAGPSGLLAVMPEAAVLRQQQKKGLKKKHQATAAEVREEALHKVILIEDRKGRPAPVAKAAAQELPKPSATKEPQTAAVGKTAPTAVKEGSKNDGLAQKKRATAMISVAPPQRGGAEGRPGAATAPGPGPAAAAKPKVQPAGSGPATGPVPAQKPGSVEVQGSQPPKAPGPARGSLASIFDSLLDF